MAHLIKYYTTNVNLVMIKGDGCLKALSILAIALYLIAKLKLSLSFESCF